MLLNANDWEFLFDLGDSPLVFPPEIAVTIQRPDILIFSRSKKAVLIIELTVPLQDRVTAGHYTAKKIAMPRWFSNALNMDGLLAVLRLKWVPWAMYLHPYYIVSNP